MEFLKILWNNLRQGVVTEAFPFAESPTPERLRGRVVIDGTLCVGCGTCKHVCTAGAIDISRLEDGEGFEITVWQNSCCLCAQCRHYCPTKAITLVNDWHSAHRNEDKYTRVTRARVRYDHCTECGAPMRFLPPSVLEGIAADHPELDIAGLSTLCPACRRLRIATLENPASVEAAAPPAVEGNPVEAKPMEAKPAEASQEAVVQTPPASSVETALEIKPAQAPDAAATPSDSAPARLEEPVLVVEVEPLSLPIMEVGTAVVTASVSAEPPSVVAPVPEPPSVEPASVVAAVGTSVATPSVETSETPAVEPEPVVSTAKASKAKKPTTPRAKTSSAKASEGSQPEGKPAKAKTTGTRKSAKKAPKEGAAASATVSSETPSASKPAKKSVKKTSTRTKAQ